MNLQVAIDSAMDLIGTRETQGTWNTTTMTRFLNTAQRYWWAKIASFAPHVCYEEQYVTFASSDISKPLVTTALPLSVLTILGVFRMQGPGVLSESNRPTPIFPENIVDLEAGGQVRYGYDGQGTLHLRNHGEMHVMVRLVRACADLVLHPTASELFAGKLPHLHDLVVFHACELACVKVRELRNDFARLQKELWDESIVLLKTSQQMPGGMRHVSTRR